jgi:hypothetical protein
MGRGIQAFGTRANWNGTLHFEMEEGIERGRKRIIELALGSSKTAASDSPSYLR